MSVALSADVAIVGASGKNSNAGGGYLYSRSGTAWSEFQLNPSFPPASGDLYGASASLSVDTILLGSPGKSGKGAAYALRYTNVSLSSDPTGRTFTLSGPGCGRTGTFTAPYSGLWSNCTVQWTSPDATAADTRYTLQNWSDGGGPLNPRTFTPSPNPVLPPSSFTGIFGIEYLLTTHAVPNSGGSMSGAGWYPAGTTTGIAAVPQPGFVFTGFSGAFTGTQNPHGLLIDSPKDVTGNFTTTPPAVMSGAIVNKNGSPNSRVWNITVTNNGPGIAYDAQLFVLSFTQTFGTACISPPVRLSPDTYPISLGNSQVGETKLTSARIDFTGCPVNARFTVNLGYMSNGGASGGLITLVNQTQ
jgi:hypothetical protein